MPQIVTVPCQRKKITSVTHDAENCQLRRFSGGPLRPDYCRDEDIGVDDQAQADHRLLAERAALMIVWNPPCAKPVRALLLGFFSDDA